jgi:hypothetical protein
LSKCKSAHPEIRPKPPPTLPHRSPTPRPSMIGPGRSSAPMFVPSRQKENPTLRKDTGAGFAFGMPPKAAEIGL